MCHTPTTLIDRHLTHAKMTVDIKDLDAHEQPSEELKAKWKAYSKMEQQDLIDSGDIDDLEDPAQRSNFCLAGAITAKQLNNSFKHIYPADETPPTVENDVPIYYHPLLPGLLLVPSLVPPEVQKILLNHLIHRDLSVPHHQTNLHLHYDLPYPSPTPDDPSSTSFFTYPPSSPITFSPKDPTIHKPLTIKQVLDRKLHWVTLGGQYDWTNRIYPGSEPPTFPRDISSFLETLFPETLAQAAIVNLYTPGDTMMMHRDVSEEVDRGLVSVSIGCDSLFMIAPNDMGKMSEQEKQGMDGRGYLLLRMRSGDALYMTGESRFAWHGVPKIFKGTCPEYLEDWPAEGEKFEEWRGWMRGKRVNLNVRQMRD